MADAASRPSRGFRSFDPGVLGRAETDAWAAYYRREWAVALRAFLTLVREGFGLSWPDTVRGAWSVLRANRAWAPVPDNDPDAARSHMRRFYELVARTHRLGIDPGRAAELEVEWWRVHRAHQRGVPGGGHRPGDDELVDAVAALYSYVYGTPVAAVRDAARLRADAMDVSDAWVAAGCDPGDPRLVTERDLLVASYRALSAAVAPAQPHPSAVLREATTWPSPTEGWGADRWEVVRRWAGLARRLDVPGAATRVWERGSGAPVVCVHGVPETAFVFRRLLGELADRDVRAIALDLPGMGLAERPEAFDYSWTGLSAWLVDALDALGLDRCHLVLHDLGGPVGLDAFRRAPDRVASITIVDSPSDFATFRRVPVMAPLAVPFVGEAYLATMTPRVMAAVLRRLAVSGPVPAAELEAYSLLLKGDDGGRAFLRIMRRFTLTREFDDGIRSAITAHRPPAQVVWGRHDTQLPVHPHAGNLRRLLQAPGIDLLPAAHLAPEDAPVELARRVAGLARNAS